MDRLRGMGIKAWLKRVLFRVFYYSGLELLLARLVKVNAAAMIMYHGVCDDSRLPPEVDFHLSRAAFDSHLRMLKSRYSVVSLSDLLGRLERGDRLGKEIVITFDDGYRNNATAAHPILERHGLPYAIFLATAYIGNGTWLPLNRLYALWSFARISGSQMAQTRTRMRGARAVEAAAIVEDIPAKLTPAETHAARDSFDMLTWDEVRALASRGVEFGSHTHTHCNMAVETAEQQRAELETAQKLMREQTGTSPATFAYPFGRPENWNRQTREQVIAAGHRCAILATGGVLKPGQDPFALPRIGYYEETWYFAAELTFRFLKEWLRTTRR